MIRHLIVERGSAIPRVWDPHAPGPNLPRDCPYFGKVLVEFEKQVGDEQIHCYLTWDNDSLPEYGPHVVAVLIGEESGLIPRYARHVRMVARVMSRYPFLGLRRWLPVTRLTFLLSLKHLRNWVRHFWSWLRFQFPPSSWPKPVRENPHIVHLPWGSASLQELTMKKISERPYSYFFSGGISHKTDRGYRKIIGGPKIYSRQALVEAIDKLEAKYPELASNRAIVVHKNVGTGALKDNDAYAQRMMDSKVCLAPRGTVADTWRFFEGLKSGSVVITNPLPDEWYYRDAPVIQLDCWKDLEDVLIPLLANEAKLEEIHENAVKYWNSVCGEEAVGRYLARALRESGLNVNNAADLIS